MGGALVKLAVRVTAQRAANSAVRQEIHGHAGNPVLPGAIPGCSIRAQRNTPLLPWGSFLVGQPVEGQTSHEAFATYVLPEVEVLLRVARALTRQSADAEDLVQDTLIRAYRSIDRFDGRHPRAWLLTILRNAHRNGGRRRHPAVAPEGEAERLAAPADDEPEAAVLMASFDAAVERAFGALPDRFRRVIELVDLDGLSYQEAAVTLGLPTGTVMSRLHRGRSRIRASLGTSGTQQWREDER